MRFFEWFFALQKYVKTLPDPKSILLGNDSQPPIPTPNPQIFWGLGVEIPSEKLKEISTPTSTPNPRFFWTDRGSPISIPIRIRSSKYVQNLIFFLKIIWFQSCCKRYVLYLGLLLGPLSMFVTFYNKISIVLAYTTFLQVGRFRVK